jgi:3-deoxy-D-manno-octulosonic-acid transferase
LFNHAGLRVRRHSEPLTAACQDVLVVDALGVLASLYASADIAFVGGSLVKKGGQNPIEPAAAGCPVLFGPDMSDFPDVAQGLLEVGAAQIVHGPDEFQHCLEALLDSPDQRLKMAEQGKRWTHSQAGAKTAICSEIVTFLAAKPRAEDFF